MQLIHIQFEFTEAKKLTDASRHLMKPFLLISELSDEDRALRSLVMAPSSKLWPFKFNLFKECSINDVEEAKALLRLFSI